MLINCTTTLRDQTIFLNTGFRRFSRWSVEGVRHQILVALAEDAEFDDLLVDRTIVRAHQHAAGGDRGLQGQAIGRSAAA
ncbi:MAG TPA: hypothetical protein VNS22_11970 [Geminicoccus sp.]|uniref:hypothetical protein n=1 Tax=Geminicoccus sp. TaxID=2024832 RepID=UPI002B5E6410|nr:hypothetical protein [Geminicoccus sp.]HWL69090.1 hypothetical protein [Geminicoccus sp.]